VQRQRGSRARTEAFRNVVQLDHATILRPWRFVRPSFVAATTMLAAPGSA
jgi:hypothetical protein